MFAVIQTGGKQYKVEVGSLVNIEKIENQIGDKVELEVLLTSDEGNLVCGSDAKKLVCTAEVVAQDKAKKIIVYKYKPKKNSRKKQGHRQPFTTVKVLEIK